MDFDMFLVGRLSFRLSQIREFNIHVPSGQELNRKCSGDVIHISSLSLLKVIIL